VAAARIVEALDEVEHRHPGLGMGAPVMASDELALKGRVEAFRHGVVVAVTDRAHGLGDSGFPTAPTEGQTGVLAAVVGVMHQARRRTPMLDGHGQGVEHEPGTQMVRHGPPDHPSAIGIDHDRQVEEALPGGQVGVGSDRGVVPKSPSVGFLGPPSEPDVQLSLHPALHGFMPLVRVSLVPRSPMAWGCERLGIGSVQPPPSVAETSRHRRRGSPSVRESGGESFPNSA